MKHSDRVLNPGLLRCTRFAGLALVCLILLAANVLAEQSDPNPSPLFEQSLNASVAKFSEGDQGGGSPQLLAVREAKVQAEPQQPLAAGALSPNIEPTMPGYPTCVGTMTCPSM